MQTWGTVNIYQHTATLDPSKQALPVIGYRPNAVNFDGTNDYLTRGGDLTGNADGKVGIVSVWFNMQGGDGVVQRFIMSTDSGVRFLVDRLDTNKFRVFGLNADGVTTALNLQSTTSITTSSGWVHVMASWDTATSTGKLYLNGVDDTNLVTVNNATIDYTQAGYSVGADQAGLSKLNALVADLYVNLAASIDLTSASNRAKFYLNGWPVYLGSDGSLPTGTAPIAYFSGATSAWKTNKGTGGGFTENGTLTSATTSPGGFNN